MRTNAIRGTAAAVLLSATVLGLAGCVNAEKPAPPGAGDSTSFGPPVTQSAPATTTTKPPSGSGSPSTGASVTTAAQTADRHNQTDVTFAKRAVLLRQQALTLAGAARTAGVNTQLKSLATGVTTGGPKVDTLSSWLSAWGQQVPTPADFPTAGVLTRDQLRHVTATQGTAFDMQWLQYMKANLDAARQAANAEVARGSNPQAEQAARHWVTVLRTESNTLAAIH